MNLHLVDIQPGMVEAWRETFAPYPEVSIQCADILDVAHGTLVSPANSHGFMDGGIDRHYRDFFGHDIERKVQRAIQHRPEGLLPVGASLVVETGHARITHLVIAPTMEMPEPVPASHAYRALRAVLRIVGSDPILGADTYCPGLCTLTGRVPYAEAAREMAEAYRDWST
ncbi:MAG: macro domain-containing protein [Bradymonadia bacterium]